MRFCRNGRFISRSQENKIKKQNIRTQHALRYWIDQCNMLEHNLQVEKEQNEFVDNFPRNVYAPYFDPKMSDFYEGIDNFYEEVNRKYECPNGFLRLINKMLGR